MGIEADRDALPSRLALVQNYPNPFNPLTTIGYALPEQVHVTITIYDILGRRIETLVDVTEVAGYHQVRWDGSHYASGIYFYSLVAGDYSESRRMIMLK